jgi:hypothetical protein
VVEASILARLLRWRVLTIDASIVLLPADAPRGDADGTTPYRDTSSRRPASRRRLSEAIENIDQADRELARARDTNQTGTPLGRTPHRARASSHA